MFIDTASISNVIYIAKKSQLLTWAKGFVIEEFAKCLSF